MTESRLYKWVVGYWSGDRITGCMLLQDPYVGVVVEFGTADMETVDTLNFNWRILDSAECQEELTTDNIVFTKYLERIVRDRLKEIGETIDVEEDMAHVS